MQAQHERTFPELPKRLPNPQWHKLLLEMVGVVADNAGGSLAELEPAYEAVARRTGGGPEARAARAKKMKAEGGYSRFTQSFFRLDDP